MTPITLDYIKAEHTRLANLIASFEAQEASEIHFPETLIALQPGEHYAGLIIGKDGEPSYHLVLLPGDEESITWDKAMTWAAQRGSLDAVASLPTRREQALLYANLKEQFESAWYWSSEAHESDSGYAWYQHFGLGYQSSTLKGYVCRARAVRRLPI